MNVPKLRFKEFKDSYILDTYDNVINIIDGDRGNNYPKESDFYDDEYCLFLNAGNVTKNGFNFSNNSFITLKKDSELRSGKLRRNDVVLTTRGTVGNIALYDDSISFENIRINSGMVINRIKSNKLLPQYLYQFMQSSIFDFQVKKSNFGSAQPQLTKKGIAKFNIAYPSIKEQRKVFNFLTLLDKKIELQTKKIEALKLFKLGLAKSVFNSSKANIDLKLKDIALIEKGKQVNGEQLLDKGNYYVLNGGINPSGFLNEYNREENTITISEGGNSCGYVSFNKSKFWCGGHCYSLSPININNQYLYHLLKYHEIKIMNLRVGSGLPNIQKKDLENISIKIHSDKDQKNISSFLSKYDKKLYFENKKLKSLNNLKKGLLQKMFV